MSYILEALKKSDQQRQRGATPTLQVAQVTVATPKRPTIIHYGLLAAVILGTGIMIGWLQPWQTEQRPLETEHLATESPILITEQTVHLANTTKPGNSAPNNSGTPSMAAPIPDKTMPDNPPSLAGVAQEQEVLPLEALPLHIRQEIPDMAVQLHAYSSEPSERLVSVNSIRLREGGSLMLGLRLERITPDGMIFSYKGYRFQRGIR